MADPFVEDLIRLGVRRDIAQSFAETNGFTQSLTETHEETKVGGRAAVGQVAVPSVIPQPPPGSPASHLHQVRGTGDSKQDPPFTRPTTGSTTGNDGSVVDTGPSDVFSRAVDRHNASGPVLQDPTFKTWDWRQYVSDWGFTPDMIDYLDKLQTQYGTDPTGFQQAALYYIRGTQWYQQHFPGIGSGENLGLFSDEASYRAYVGQANDLYQRVLGRAPSAQEIQDYISKGYNPTMIGEHVQGISYLKDPNNQFNLTYTLGAFDSSKVDKSQYGNLADSLFGLNNTSGDALLSRLQAATTKMQRIFQGTAATPALSLLNNGQLAERGANKADVGS